MTGVSLLRGSFLSGLRFVALVGRIGGKQEVINAKLIQIVLFPVLRVRLVRRIVFTEKPLLHRSVLVDRTILRQSRKGLMKG